MWPLLALSVASRPSGVILLTLSWTVDSVVSVLPLVAISLFNFSLSAVPSVYICVFVLSK